MTEVSEYLRKYLSINVHQGQIRKILYPQNISAILYAIFFKKAKPAVIMTTSMKRETDDKGLTHKHGTPYAYKGEAPL